MERKETTQTKAFLLFFPVAQPQPQPQTSAPQPCPLVHPLLWDVDPELCWLLRVGPKAGRARGPASTGAIWVGARSGAGLDSNLRALAPLQSTEAHTKGIACQCKLVEG